LTDDPYNLKRFLDAQSTAYETARKELQSGLKLGHWIWFIFPQIAGLGTSATSRHFAITSLEEAEAYLKHPVLGPRIRECSHLVFLVEGRSTEQIFGSTDDLKFRSSMTLFARASSDSGVFKAALDKYYGGIPDHETLRRL
jgi:uncharacterized protein (DUF1810 family)